MCICLLIQLSCLLSVCLYCNAAGSHNVSLLVVDSDNVLYRMRLDGSAMDSHEPQYMGDQTIKGELLFLDKK